MPLIFLGFLLVFATSVSAQTPLSPPAFFAAPGTQTPVAAASDGTNFLAVWTDTRPAAGLYAARVAYPAAGSDVPTVLDRVGIPIAYGSIAHATAFWNGISYSIYWEDASGINVRHLTPDGALDGRTLVVPQGHATTNRFAAQGPGGFVAIVHDAKIDFTDNTGTAVHTSVAIANATSMSVASDGSDFFAVWYDGTDVLGQRYFVDGGAKSDAFRLSSLGGDETSPLVFGGRNQYLILTSSSALVARVYGSTTGLSQPFPLSNGTSPAAVGGANGFDLVYVANGSVVSTTITSAGPGFVSIVAASGTAPQAASNGRDLFVAWGDRTSPRDINATIVGRTSATRITSAAQNQTQSNIAWSPSGVWGVVWTETLADGQSTAVKFQRVGPSGSTLDGSGITLGNPAEVNSNPSITFDGTNFVVAFNAARGSTTAVATARISPAGTLLDGATGVHAVEGVCSAPAIASDKIGAAFAYVECGFGTVHVRRVTGNGAGQDLQVTIAGGSLVHPRLVSNGNEFLISWENDRRLMVARISPSLQLLDPVPILITTDGGNASLAQIGTGFAIVWEAIDRVWLRTIDAAGNLTSPLIATGIGTSPRVAADGDLIAITYVRDGVPYLMHLNQFDERQLAPSGTEVIWLNTPGGKATLYASIMRDTTYGGVNRLFISIADAPPPVLGRHRAVRK